MISPDQLPDIRFKLDHIYIPLSSVFLPDFTVSENCWCPLFSCIGFQCPFFSICPNNSDLDADLEEVCPFDPDSD